MNEIIQLIGELIKDGINWQETIVLSAFFITLGFIVWVIITGIISFFEN